MDFRRYGSFNILTFSLPLFCLVITWAASTATTTPGLPNSPPPPTVLAAAEILRTRGYSLIASTLLATVTFSNNFSGTILAPPDFAFSFTVGKFSPNHHVPLRPSAAVFLYHTLREPLTWHNLSSLVDGNELPTFYNGNCLFVKNSNGAVSVSVSASKRPISAVRIKQPDMYADDHLVVHGVEGILDPTSASKCSDSRDHTPAVQPPLVDRKFLDHAVRAIRRRGFTVAAAGLSIKRLEMLRLGAVSLFAPSDRALFSRHGGFSFDFRSHVLPTRHRLEDLARYPPKITIFPTLAANRTIMVDSVNGAVTVNGVRVNSTEVYLNRWIVVFSVSTSLDYDAGNLLGSGGAAQIPPPPSHAVQYPPPTHFETPPLPLPLSPPPTADAHESQCRISDFPVEIEGGDLLCPVPARSLMEDGEALTAESAYEDTAQSLPSDEDQLPEDVTLSSVDSGGDEDQVPVPTLRDQVNIADDLFFYS